jgi:hypothetical protein
MFSHRGNQKKKLSISAVVFILLFNCSFVQAQAQNHAQHSSKMKLFYASRAQSAKSSKSSSSSGNRVLKGNAKSKSPLAINFGPGPGTQVAKGKGNGVKTILPYASRSHGKTKK